MSRNQQRTTAPYLDIEAREENEREDIRPPKRRCLNRRAIILDDSD